MGLCFCCMKVSPRNSYASKQDHIHMFKTPLTIQRVDVKLVVQGYISLHTVPRRTCWQDIEHCSHTTPLPRLNDGPTARQEAHDIGRTGGACLVLHLPRRRALSCRPPSLPPTRILPRDCCSTRADVLCGGPEQCERA
jgi:hypothetical protein